MFAFNLLSISLSNHMLFSGSMTFVGTPVVSKKSGDSEWCEKFFEFEKDDIFAITKHIGQDVAGGMIKGVPEPALIFLAPNITPHLIHFYVFNLLNAHSNFAVFEALQHGVVD